MKYRDFYFLKDFFNESVINLNNLDAMWRALYGDHPTEGAERKLYQNKFDKMKAKYEKENGKYIDPETRNKKSSNTNFNKNRNKTNNNSNYRQQKEWEEYEKRQEEEAKANEYRNSILRKNPYGYDINSNLFSTNKGEIHKIKDTDKYKDAVINYRATKAGLNAANIIGGIGAGVITGKAIKDIVEWEKLSKKSKMRLYEQNKKKGETFSQFEKRIKRKNILMTAGGIGITGLNIAAMAMRRRNDKNDILYKKLKNQGIVEEYQMYELGYNDAYNDIINEIYDEENDKLDFLY